MAEGSGPRIARPCVLPGNFGYIDTACALSYCLGSVRKVISLLTLAVALAGLSFAATVAGPVSRVQPDSQIQHSIEAKFAKSKINAEHFTVSVHGGVAVIDGKTGVIQHKGVATRLAKTGGAQSVQNRIQVSEEAKAKARARLSGKAGMKEVARATVLPQASVR